MGSRILGSKGEDQKRHRRRVLYEPMIIELSLEDSNKILDSMTKAFVSSKHDGRLIDDPFVYSKRLLAMVCDGKKYDGSVWKNAPGRAGDDTMTILKKRLATYGYDMDTGQIFKKLRNGLAATKQFIGQEQNVDGRVKYGSSIDAVLNPGEKKTYKKFLSKLQEEFPELDTESDRLGMSVLAMLKLKMDRFAMDVGGDPRHLLSKDAVDVAQMYQRQTENLGIAGKQRRDFLEQEGNKTLGDLARTYHDRLKTHAVDVKNRYLQECELLMASYRRGDIEESDVVRFANSSLPDVAEFLKRNGIESGEPQ